MEQEVKKIINISSLKNRIDDCFFACVLMYINYLSGDYRELLQITWYWKYRKSSAINTGITLINFEELNLLV